MYVAAINHLKTFLIGFGFPKLSKVAYKNRERKSQVVLAKVESRAIIKVTGFVKSESLLEG